MDEENVQELKTEDVQTEENEQAESATEPEPETEETSEGPSEEPSDETPHPETAVALAAVPEEIYVDKSVTEQKDKRRKRKKILTVIFATAGGAVVTAYLVTAVWFTMHFNNNTFIDGQNVSFRSVASVKAAIDDYKKEYSLTVNGRDGELFTIVPDEINMTLHDVSDEKSIKKQQNGFLWFLYANNKTKEYYTSYETSYDETKLEEFLSGQDCLKAQNMKKPENAYVTVENGAAKVVNETDGSYLDFSKVKEATMNALNDAAASVDLEDSGCYEEAEIKADSEQIAEEKKELESYLEMTITYSIDQVSWTLASDTFGAWMSYKNGTWTFDRDQVAAYVAELAETYDTVGTTRTFQTYTGRYVEETGKRYGWAIDTEAETDGLLAALESGESQDRTPEFSQTGAAYTKYGDIGYSYIEVDLSNQHVYMILNGKLAVESDCVTGCVKNGHGTPDGLYSIAYMESPSVLVGEDYESHVTYWMPFNGGIGLHDASWRKKFGGDIYYTSGSHGCVNLPLKNAAAIYERAYSGMPVICYY